MVQSHVNVDMPVGWNGDFGGANTRTTMIGPEGAWMAGPNGVRAGSFVWCTEASNTVANSGSGTPDGFVRRGGLSAVMQLPGRYSMTIPAGTPLTVFNNGDFRVDLPTGVTAAMNGAVWVSPTTGAIVAASAPGAVKTRWTYAESGTPGESVKISSWIVAKS